MSVISQYDVRGMGKRYRRRHVDNNRITARVRPGGRLSRNAATIAWKLDKEARFTLVGLGRHDIMRNV